ncbi:nitroreductase family protein [Roseibium polysiphoniae]|uniref:Putative NAD(P)H nitroreductase n=1 Tax=Roseibium polysiphoniae TaxID=2571221 RepID=A0ABR9CCF6_9HYPH|nr:nitroreductase [Roseibium polysiphoniae]MBD8876592.1 nitroreductase [Roseibium polysiphoniae]
MSTYSPRRQEALDFLLTRRSHPCVTMTEPGPGESDLRDILTVAARVPDHGKLAPWRFVIYREAKREIIGRKLLEICEAENGPLDEARKEQELSRFSRAPLVIGVISTAAIHPKIPVWEQELSAGAVCMNLVSAASAAGYASQWLSEWYCFHETAARYLGCGEDERFAGFIHIGTPTQAPFERPRPDLADICTDWSET